MNILRALCINSFIKNILHKEIFKIFGATFKMKAKSMYFLKCTNLPILFRFSTMISLLRIFQGKAHCHAMMP